MSMELLKSGLLTTIQDLGRIGYQRDGVIVSGAMDPFSLRLANTLIGNNDNDAGLEITFSGPSIRFKKETLLAITGANLSPMIDGRPVPLNRPVLIKGGRILSFGQVQSGCRAYVAVAGGCDVRKVMGSRSTYLRAKLGGYNGRALKGGDEIPIGEATTKAKKLIASVKESNPDSFASTNWDVRSPYSFSYKRPHLVRVMEGQHFDLFKAESKMAFFEEKFKVSPESDRMGYRLAGNILSLKEPVNIVSEPITTGAIQVPANGNPIILMADRQTTGGYPIIGQISSVDLSVIAQAKPGEEIYFQKITLQEAETLYLKREYEVNEIKAGINAKLLASK
ncbi:biotin-dependent carboxyltransferase family protein [Bacillus suaedae]|nr:biotin-dependent carboxyltransferase family protein [Bacillus suaedae]